MTCSDLDFSKIIEAEVVDVYFYTRNEASEKLGVSTRTVHNYLLSLCKCVPYFRDKFAELDFNGQPVSLNGQSLTDKDLQLLAQYQTIKNKFGTKRAQTLIAKYLSQSN